VRQFGEIRKKQEALGKLVSYEWVNHYKKNFGEVQDD
jgi:hypothetical protein